MNKILKIISKGLFNKKNENAVKNVKVIVDLDKAEVYAFQQFNLETVWTDLKSDNSLILKHATDNDEDFWAENYSETIYNQLNNTIYNSFINEIDTDLFNCYINDKYSLNNSFWNMIFECYYTGFMPCGWEGEYPEGTLVVFSPMKNN